MAHRFVSSRALLELDFRAAIGPAGLLLGLLLLVEIAQWQAPWAGDPEVVPFLYELLTIAVTTALSIIIASSQRRDLLKERLRHLFSLPVTPTQVVLSKALVCGALCAMVLPVVNLFWFLLCAPTGESFNLGQVLRISADMWLITLLLWSLWTVTYLVGTWVTVLVVSASIFFGRDIPESFHPLTLSLPLEGAGLSLIWARVITAVAIIVLILISERLLALRTIK